MKAKLISVLLMIALLAGLCVHPVYAVDTASEFALHTEMQTVVVGAEFEITTAFTEQMNSNTAVLNYSFDQSAVSYVGFIAADGVSVVSNEATETGVEIVVMIADYSTQTYGALLLRANTVTQSAPVCVQADIRYVVRNEDGTKEIKNANASIDITICASDAPQPPELEGDTNYDGVVNMLDLSNMIDWAGISDSDPNWEKLYVFFDFNNNGEIDVYDIAYVASLIIFGEFVDFDDMIARVEQAAEAAKAAAEAAKASAEAAAKAAAEAANATAEDRAAAEAAKAAAEVAKAKAEEAQRKAEEAETAAKEAKDEASVSAAQAALDAAKAAEEAANAAASAAAAAAAQAKAQAAQAAAEKAQAAAEAAQAKAEELANDVNADKESVEKALAAAEAAKTAAEEAQKAAENAQAAANNSNKEAAEYAAQVAEAQAEIAAIRLELLGKLEEAVKAAADAEAARKAAEEERRAAEEARKAAEAAALAASKYAAAISLDAYADDTNVHVIAARDAAVEAIKAAQSIEAVERALEDALAAIESAGEACKLLAFDDLDPTRWYHDGIEFMLHHEYMIGTGETTFAPNATLTRGQLVTILYRIEGEPDVAELDHTFVDVGKAYYTNAVIWAADAGIVNGTSETTFEPKAPITREQMATILYRYAEATAVEDDNKAAFPDASDVSGFAEESVNWALEIGLINGVSSGDETYLQPKAAANRAQVAVILYRYLIQG